MPVESLAHEAFKSFRNRYFHEKGRPFYTGESREFVATTIRSNQVNTELILCLSGIKPVSRFIVEAQDDREFLKTWAKENDIFFLSRELRTKESLVNLNPKIRYIAYFSKQKELLEIAANSDEKGWVDNEIEIGKLLWYPDCCNIAWAKNGAIARIPDRVDFLFTAYLENACWINNPFFNFIDRSISFFYPCHLGCEKAKACHEEFFKTLQDAGYSEFTSEIERLFKLPILLVWPKDPETLTLYLHFDEIFRVHFVGKQIRNNIVVYSDFFISSLSFLDQISDEAYKTDCIDLLHSLILGDNVTISEDRTLQIRKGRTEIASYTHQFRKTAILSFS